MPADDLQMLVMLTSVIVCVIAFIVGFIDNLIMCSNFRPGSERGFFGPRRPIKREELTERGQEAIRHCDRALYVFLAAFATCVVAAIVS